MSPSIYNLPHRSTSGGSDAVFSLPQNQKDLSIVKDKEGRLWRIVDINGQGVNQSQIKAANQLAQTILAQSPRKADMSKEADEKSSLGILNSSNPDSMIITMDYDTTSSVLTANIVEKKDNASIDTGIKPISIKDNSDKDIENVLKDLVSKTENVAKDILIQPKIGQGSKVLVEDEAVDVDGIEVLDKQDAAAIEIDEIDDKEDSESARLIPSQPPVQLDDDKLAAPNLANPELIYEGMGKEQVEGFAAVKNTIDNAKEAILSLQYQLADPNVVDKQPIQDAILYYKNKIQNATSWAEKYGGWINSNGWRDLIHDTKDYFTAVDQFIACPVNMRYHSFAKDMMSSPQGVIRMAVITDVRNGWFNLQYL